MTRGPLSASCMLLAACAGSEFAQTTGGTDMARAIAQHRMGTLVIEAKPGATLRVQQERHEFWFGATLSYRVFRGDVSAEDDARYKETFVANFNAGVTENAVKWLPMERERGKVDYSVVDATLAWAEAHGIPVRGHCLFWGVPSNIQDWVKVLGTTGCGRRSGTGRSRRVAGTGGGSPSTTSITR